MKIRVTKEDIRKGKRWNDACCPVALAIRRETNDKQWRVFTLLAMNKKLGCHEWLSESTIRFIRRFDAGKNVKPFTFVLKINR